MPKKIYMIEARSVHSTWYAVHADEMPNYELLRERLQSGTLHELSQAWLGDTIESVVELTEEDFLKHPVINYIKSDDVKRDAIIDLEAEVRYEDPANSI